MARHCRTCTHPERERIELELANAPALADVSRNWGIPTSSLSRHRNQHMTQEQIARLRHGFPDDIEISIDELTRQGGQGAILGLKRLGLELQEIAKRCDAIGDFPNGIRARTEQKSVYKEQARLAAMYPGLKSTTNNHLVIADGVQIFDLVNRVLARAETVTDARRMLAAEYRTMAAAPLPLLLEAA